MRVVIARFPNAGFGDHLSGLMGAWYLAQCTNRTLVIDWRGSRYNSDKSRNCFHNFFKQRDFLGGVPVISGDDVADIDYEFPVFPTKWSRDSLAATEHLPHTPEEWDTTNVLMAEGSDRPEPTIVINQDASISPPRNKLRELLADLEFSDKIVTPAREFVASKMATDPYIGIHIRHGNGENIGGRAVYWLDGLDLIRQLRMNKKNDIFQARQSDRDSGTYADNMPPSLMASPRQTREETRLYDAVSGRVRELREATGRELPVFLCTDATRVIKGIEDRVGRVVTYPKTMLEESAGPLHQTQVSSGSASSGAVAKNLIDDMLIETEILRRSASIICIPSQFSILPRIELEQEDIHLLKPSFANRIIGRFFA